MSRTAINISALQASPNLDMLLLCFSASAAASAIQTPDLVLGSHRAPSQSETVQMPQNGLNSKIRKTIMLVVQASPNLDMLLLLLLCCCCCFAIPTPDFELRPSEPSPLTMEVQMLTVDVACHGEHN
jgi:hypothetical protein